MADAGGSQPKSSWRRWTRSGADDAPAAAADDDGLDVELTWPDRDEPALPPRTVEPVPDEPYGSETEFDTDAKDEDQDEHLPAADEAQDVGDELDIEVDPAVDEPTGGGWDVIEFDDGADADSRAGLEPLLPAMASRIDVVQGGVNALAMRLEALLNATGGLRSTINERVDEYTATVSKLSLSSARDLDEYRRTTERALAELRRSAMTTDDVLSQLGSRTDELATDVASLTDLVRSLTDDIRAAGSAARVRPGPSTEHRELVEALGAVRAELTALRAEAATAPAPPVPDPELVELVRSVGRLRSDVDSLPSSVATAAVTAATKVAPAASPEAVAQLGEIVADLGAQVAEVRRAVDALASSQPPEAPDHRPALAALADAVEVVARDLDNARTRQDPVRDAIAGVAEAMEAVRTDVTWLRHAPVPDAGESIADLAGGLDALRHEVARLGTDPPPGSAIDDEVTDALEALRQEVAALRAVPPPAIPDPSGELADVADAVDALRADVAKLRPPADDDALDVAAELLAEVRSLGDEVADVRKAVGRDPASTGALLDALDRLGDGVAALPEVRELLAVVVDGLPDSQEGSGGLDAAVRALRDDVAELVARPVAVDLDLDALAERIAARLEVMEVEPAPAPPPPKPRAPRKAPAKKRA